MRLLSNNRPPWTFFPGCSSLRHPPLSELRQRLRQTFKSHSHITPWGLSISMNPQTKIFFFTNSWNPQSSSHIPIIQLLALFADCLFLHETGLPTISSNPEDNPQPAYLWLRRSYLLSDCIFKWIKSRALLIKYNIRLLEKLQKAKDHNLIWAFGGRLRERMKNTVLEAFILSRMGLFQDSNNCKLPKAKFYNE